MVRTISKDQIINLPLACFKGRIVLVQTESELEKAVSYLSKCDKIGFDTETRPAFQKGRSHKIALMQLATEDTCFLLRLNVLGFPALLLNFLMNPKVKKIGLSLKDDFSIIRRSTTFNPQGFIDLQVYVKDFGIEDISLQRIYAILFGERISKNQRLTNWEAELLTEGQQMYAALDAWACLKIYNELDKISNSGKKHI
ncbi:3'-5' exonuclease [Viscerimonas tarda]